MKRTRRENIVNLPYSLHDMHLTGFMANGDELTFKFEKGFEENTPEGKLVNGEIRFYKVDWDFCFTYVLDFCGNEGSFTGHKYYLADFIRDNKNLDFEIIDETYGYNSSKFAGWLREKDEVKECVLELYHFGAMEYIVRE